MVQTQGQTDLPCLDVLLCSLLCLEDFVGPWCNSLHYVSEKHRLRKVHWQNITKCNYYR